MKTNILLFIKDKYKSFFKPKLLKKVILISQKYNLSKIIIPKEYKNIYKYLDDNPDKRNIYQSDFNDYYLMNKYRKYVSYGHYGFSLGEPINSNWNKFIDEVLDLLIKTDPEFEIQQIKMKWGRICFYCSSNKIKDINEISNYIYTLLSDDIFIY